jgi:HAD superfamily hydrolase (TIGR01549 family)
MSGEKSVVFGEIDRSRVRGLLFDVDGTLSDTDDRMVDRVARFLKPIAWLFKDKNPRRFARWFIMGVETPANFLYGLADQLGLDQLFSRLYNWLSQKHHAANPDRERYSLIPGVKGMLDALAGQYPMAVVSARDSESTNRFLKYFDLEKYFEVIVTAQTCPHTKPFPDPVLYAAEQLGLSPEDCVMIGDTIVDVHAGRAANTQTVAVLCGFGVSQELEQAGADLILSTTSDILKILFD